jgi:hypothetical protein
MNMKKRQRRSLSAASEPAAAETPARRSRLDLVLGVAVLAVLVFWLFLSKPSGSPDGGDSGLSDSTASDRLDRDYEVVPFARLSAFAYDDRRPTGNGFDSDGGVPDGIRRLSGRKVAVDGFMMPLDFVDGAVTRFVLNSSYDMCMFGAPSRATERIDVEMARGRTAPFTHRPLRVYGVLDVGARWEAGRVTSLYRLQAHAVGEPGLGY